MDATSNVTDMNGSVTLGGANTYAGATSITAGSARMVHAEHAADDGTFDDYGAGAGVGGGMAMGGARKASAGYGLRAENAAPAQNAERSEPTADEADAARENIPAAAPAAPALSGELRDMTLAFRRRRFPRRRGTRCREGIQRMNRSRKKN